MCNQKKGVLFCTLLVFSCVMLFAGGHYGGARAFYLSTDRTYAPGESIKIKVESVTVSNLLIRVYKINDPALYFLSQDNIHRPKVRGTYHSNFCHARCDMQCKVHRSREEAI